MKAIRKQAQLPAIRLVCSIVCRTLAFVAVSASVAAAQTSLVADAEGRGAAGGPVVIALHAGTKVVVVAMRDANALVTVEGWVDESRLAGKLDTFPASVDGKAALRVRASASGTAAILAELRPRAGVRPLGKSGTWERIKRSAWIPTSALAKSTVAAAPSKPPSKPVAKPVAKPAANAPGKAAPIVAAAPAAKPSTATTVAVPAPSDTPLPAGAMSVSRATKLLAAPVGTPIGELSAGAIVQPLAHDHGWAKVRIEGWVPERDLAPTDSSFGSQLTAADLRADPEGTRGRTVQWEVEVLSLQTADPLRRELARDEPYLLARGPGTENSLLYLAVPPSLLAQAKALPPLTRVLITARVRVGHSDPVGTPILDLKSISKR